MAKDPNTNNFLLDGLTALEVVVVFTVAGRVSGNMHSPEME